jgi:DNA-binding response OmpR family regulator
MTKRILVVDDEPDVVQIVTSILQAKGYETDVAQDGQQALDKIQQRRPDLVILDLMMPVISGLEVVHRLKREEETRDLPIIVMSAAGRNSGKPEEFFREGLGSDDFISKPFEPLNLLGRVEAVLRMREYEAKGKPSPRPHQDVAPSPTSTAKVGGVKLEELPTLGPAEIVKAFVESWNTQDFAVEYRCLAPPMTGGLPQKSYVLRRQQAYADDQALDREQRVKRVVEMEADAESARVVIEREDSVRGRARLRQEEYLLERGEHSWQIKHVRPVKGA